MYWSPGRQSVKPWCYWLWRLINAVFDPSFCHSWTSGGPSKLYEASWCHARHVIPYIYCIIGYEVHKARTRLHSIVQNSVFYEAFYRSRHSGMKPSAGVMKYNKCMGSHVARDIRCLKQFGWSVCGWTITFCWSNSRLSSYSLQVATVIKHMRPNLMPLSYTFRWKMVPLASHIPS